MYYIHNFHIVKFGAMQVLKRTKPITPDVGTMCYREYKTTY